jgi:hypothetical protein
MNATTLAIDAIAPMTWAIMEISSITEVLSKATVPWGLMGDILLVCPPAHAHNGQT